MRRQFFLDARDYLKFALLEDAMACAELAQLTLVWMLTPDQSNTHGSRRPAFDPARPRLNAFFAEDPRPDLSDVPRYFKSLGYPCEAYGDSPAATQRLADRASYFGEIPSSLLCSALVFVDPDNGLEPASSATSAHLRYADAATILNRMDDKSLLVVYQHLPRVKASLFWSQIANRIRDRLATSVAWVPAGTVAFFFLSRDARLILNLRDGFAAGCGTFVLEGLSD